MSFFKKIIIKYLLILSRIQVKKFNAKVIAITGSVGKTSAKDFINSVLQQDENTKVLASKKSFNGEFGLPMTIFNISFTKDKYLNILKLLILPLYNILFIFNKYDYLVLEVGVDRQGDLDVLKQITQTDLAILLNVQSTHSANFKSDNPKEDIFREKAKIFDTLKPNTYGLINIDNNFLNRKNNEGYFDEKIQTVSKNQNSHYKYSVEENRSIGFKINTPLGTYNLNKFLPLEFAESIVFAIIVGQYFKIDNKKIQLGLEKTKLNAGRFTIFKGLKNSTILDSSYNSSPKALNMVLNFAKKVKIKDKILVLGEMRELGDAEEKEHLKVIPKIKNFKKIYLVGEACKKYILPSVSDATYFDNSYQLGKHLKSNLKTNEFYVFKGSENTIFLEEAIKHILPKHEYINLPRQEDYWLQKKLAFFKTKISKNG